MSSLRQLAVCVLLGIVLSWVAAWLLATMMHLDNHDVVALAAVRSPSLRPDALNHSLRPAGRRANSRWLKPMCDSELAAPLRYLTCHRPIYGRDRSENSPCATGPFITAASSILAPWFSVARRFVFRMGLRRARRHNCCRTSGSHSGCLRCRVFRATRVMILPTHVHWLRIYR